MTAATGEDHLMVGRAFRVDAYVDRGFERVRSYVSASPDCLLGEGVTSVYVRWAGLDLSREIRVRGGDLEMGSRFVRIPLQWADARRPARFPVLEAILEINPAVRGDRPTTQLVLSGSYRPPFGRFGAAADLLFGRYLVLQSVERFLRRLAESLERDILPEPVRWREEP